ncbi:hypothetical protein CEXT_712181 [Caerostris extrusa]|uniref:Uncharacterized protein n=1 Tax=Caerostris extrusa TaxID=172846 RepID=A0AAV4WNM5_CAEEX|nr:hypothetical protein CEXT_712181 [Caerostris extrusa]
MLQIHCIKSIASEASSSKFTLFLWTARNIYMKAKTIKVSSQVPACIPPSPLSKYKSREKQHFIFVKRGIPLKKNEHSTLFDGIYSIRITFSYDQIS